MEGAARSLLQAASNADGDTTAPFFGFIGAASALVFACAFLPHLRELMLRALQCVVKAAHDVAAARQTATVGTMTHGQVEHRSADLRLSQLICPDALLQASVPRMAQLKPVSALLPWVCCVRSLS